MPQLVALYKRNQDKGLAMIGMHVQSATDDEVKEKVKDLKIKFPVTKGGGGPSKGNGIPHTLVFDTEGKLAFEGHPAAPEFDKAVKKALKAVTASADSGSKLGPSTTKPSTTPSSTAKATALIAERPWTNVDGKVMNAALISVDGETAKFKKKDGPPFPYPLSKLSEEDQQTIKEAAVKAKEGTP